MKKLDKFLGSFNTIAFGAILSVLGLDYSASFGAPKSMVLGFLTGELCFLLALLIWTTREWKAEHRQYLVDSK